MSQPLKIAILIPSLERQASVAYPLSLSEEFIKNGHSCEIFYFREKSNAFSVKDAKRITFSTSINWNEYDVVNSHGLIPDLFCFVKKPRKNGPTFVSTLHGFFYPQFRQKHSPLIAVLLAFIWMIFLMRHDLYVVFTKYARSKYPLLRQKKMRTIASGISTFQPNPIIDEDQLLFMNLRNQGKTVIGIISRLIKSKGIDQIIRVLPQRPELHLVIAGEGPEKKQLIKLARQLNSEAQISFLGYRQNGKNYMAYFDAFIIPSRSETFGLTLLEASSLKVPIICSEIPTFKEIFTSDEVTYFALDNTNDLKRAITEALETRITKVEKCNQSFLTKYTAQTMAAEYLRIFL